MERIQIRNPILVSVCFVTLTCFVISLLFIDLFRLKISQASQLGLPEPTQVLNRSKNYSLPVFKGIRIDPENKNKIEFIIDSADSAKVDISDVKVLVDYFLTGLTIPSNNLWVNLSPYEADRIIPNTLAKSDMAKTLLSQDYILKQLTSSLTHPDLETGKMFWSSRISGEDNSFFNKVWITPDKVKLYQTQHGVLIADSKLNVLSENDYLASLSNNSNSHLSNNTYDSILSVIRDEVNNGQYFAKLRQLYSAIILAKWFKSYFNDNIYSRYIDSESMNALALDDTTFKTKIYDLYCESFKKGLYDTTRINRSGDKEKTNIKRRYFSGGIVFEHQSEYLDTRPQIEKKGKDFKIAISCSAVKNGEATLELEDYDPTQTRENFKQLTQFLDADWNSDAGQEIISNIQGNILNLNTRGVYKFSPYPGYSYSLKGFGVSGDGWVAVVKNAYVKNSVLNLVIQTYNQETDEIADHIVFQVTDELHEIKKNKNDTNPAKCLKLQTKSGSQTMKDLIDVHKSSESDSKIESFTNDNMYLYINKLSNINSEYRISFGSKENYFSIPPYLARSLDTENVGVFITAIRYDEKGNSVVDLELHNFIDESVIPLSVKVSYDKDKRYNPNSMIEVVAKADNLQSKIVDNIKAVVATTSDEIELKDGFFTIGQIKFKLPLALKANVVLRTIESDLYISYFKSGKVRIFKCDLTKISTSEKKLARTFNLKIAEEFTINTKQQFENKVIQNQQLLDQLDLNTWYQNNILKEQKDDLPDFVKKLNKSMQKKFYDIRDSLSTLSAVEVRSGYFYIGKHQFVLDSSVNQNAKIQIVGDSIWIGYFSKKATDKLILKKIHLEEFLKPVPKNFKASKTKSYSHEEIPFASGFDNQLINAWIAENMTERLFDDKIVSDQNQKLTISNVLTRRKDEITSLLSKWQPVKFNKAGNFKVGKYIFKIDSTFRGEGQIIIKKSKIFLMIPKETYVRVLEFKISDLTNLSNSIVDTIDLQAKADEIFKFADIKANSILPKNSYLRKNGIKAKFDELRLKQYEKLSPKNDNAEIEDKEVIPSISKLKKLAKNTIISDISNGHEIEVSEGVFNISDFKFRLPKIKNQKAFISHYNGVIKLAFANKTNLLVYEFVIEDMLTEALFAGKIGDLDNFYIDTLNYDMHIKDTKLASWIASRMVELLPENTFNYQSESLKGPKEVLKQRRDYIESALSSWQTVKINKDGNFNFKSYFFNANLNVKFSKAVHIVAKDSKIYLLIPRNKDVRIIEFSASDLGKHQHNDLKTIKLNKIEEKVIKYAIDDPNHDAIRNAYLIKKKMKLKFDELKFKTFNSYVNNIGIDSNTSYFSLLSKSVESNIRKNLQKEQYQDVTSGCFTIGDFRFKLKEIENAPVHLSIKDDTLQITVVRKTQVSVYTVSLKSLLSENIFIGQVNLLDKYSKQVVGFDHDFKDSNLNSWVALQVSKQLLNSSESVYDDFQQQLAERKDRIITSLSSLKPIDLDGDGRFNVEQYKIGTNVRTTGTAQMIAKNNKLILFITQSNGVRIIEFDDSQLKDHKTKILNKINLIASTDHFFDYAEIDSNFIQARDSYLSKFGLKKEFYTQLDDFSKNIVIRNIGFKKEVIIEDNSFAINNTKYNIDLPFKGKAQVEYTDEGLTILTRSSNDMKTILCRIIKTTRSKSGIIVDLDVVSTKSELKPDRYEELNRELADAIGYKLGKNISIKDEYLLITKCVEHLSKVTKDYKPRVINNVLVFLLPSKSNFIPLNKEYDQTRRIFEILLKWHKNTYDSFGDISAYKPVNELNDILDPIFKKVIAVSIVLRNDHEDVKVVLQHVVKEAMSYIKLRNVLKKRKRGDYEIKARLHNYVEGKQLVPIPIRSDITISSALKGGIDLDKIEFDLSSSISQYVTNNSNYHDLNGISYFILSIKEIDSIDSFIQ